MGEKLEIAEQLARLGVDVIEAGFPIASQGDFEAVEAIAKARDGARSSPGCRAPRSRTSTGRGRPCATPSKPRIHVFIATSPIHMKKKLRMTEDQVQAEARRQRRPGEGVLRRRRVLARGRQPLRPRLHVRGAVSWPSTTAPRPSTSPTPSGTAFPRSTRRLIRYVIENVDGEFVVSTHCHNDLGLAVANSLAGVAAGARQVECAINGLGERAGNAALEEIVMAMRTRSDYFDSVHTTVKTEELARTSRMVARLTGYPVQYNKAIIGRNAFAHEAGIHQHGVLEDRETYEIIDASTVGQEAAQIVLGKHSGRHAFADSLEKMGLHVQGDALNQAFTRFKELADRKVEITEADLEAIVAEELGIGTVHRFTMASLELRGGTRRPAECARRARRRRRQGRSRRRGQRHDRRRHRGHRSCHRHHRHRPRLQGVVGDQGR